MPLDLSRRTVLRGLGASIALPWLEAMGPLTAWADGATKPEQAAPNRMAFLYVPNGKNMADWTPKTEGTDYELPAILKPLEAVRSKFSVLTGLTADKARPHGDGGGDHRVDRTAPAGLRQVRSGGDVVSAHSVGLKVSTELTDLTDEEIDKLVDRCGLKPALVFA